jgi:ornithine cyclodeaminase/alanine dehydrogenase
MGAIVVFNGIHGFPLAIVDSIDPTIKRTGATTAVAAKYLAKKDSKIVTICGCGVQGQIQLQSLMKIFHFTEIFAYDIKPEVANEFAKKIEGLLETKITSTSNLAEACKKSDIIITCTPAKQPYIKREYLKPGVFIAAVGSDAPQKQELEAKIVSENKLIVDIVEQCARAGELHHAIEEGLMTIEQVHGSLGQVITGQVSARTNDEEIIIYDATGTAIQDVAAAATCYEKAVKLGKGQYVNFFL